VQEGMKMKTLMQGTGSKYKMRNVRNSERTHDRNVNTTDMNDLEEALGHLVKVIGEDNLIRLASVIDEDDPMVANIEIFIDAREKERSTKKKKKPERSMNGKSEKEEEEEPTEKVGKKRFY
jgi:hypothetical protein